MTSSKSAKIWRRTKVGSSIAAALALLLWIASLDPSGRPVLAFGALVLAVCVGELARMGALGGRDLAWILAVPSLGAVLVEASRLAAGAATPSAREFAFDELRALLLAAIGHGLFFTTRSWGIWRPRVRLVAGALVIAWLVRMIWQQGELPETQIWVLGAAAVVAWSAALRGAWSRRNLAIALGLAAWVVVPLPALIEIQRAFGVRGLLTLLVLSKIGDNAGYFVGSALGKHHPFPSISPGKTAEGCVASFVAGVIAGVVAVRCGGLVPNERWAGSADLVGILVGGSINLAAQAGDLFESWIKRRAGVKDASHWFGPSGGMLDLVDSLLFSVPVALCTWTLFFSRVDV